MEISELWTALQEIQKHLGIINGELGKVQTDVNWLKQSWWELLCWMRVIVGGIVVGIVLSVWNLIVVHKNGRKRT